MENTTRNIKPESTNKYFVALKQIHQEYINGTLNDKVLRQIIRKVSVTLNVVLKTLGYINYKNGECDWMVGEPTIEDAKKVHIFSLDYSRMNNSKKKDISGGKKTTLQKDKRIGRRKQTAEWFTPPWLVQEMINKIPNDCWKDANKTLLEPSCGNGVFVEMCIQKKIDNIQPKEKKLQRILNSIKSVYGVDIMVDNINETRRRILDNIIKKNLNDIYENGKLTNIEYNNWLIELTSILLHNIKTTDDTLKIDFDSWKSWDEESKDKKNELRNLVKINFYNILKN